MPVQMTWTIDRAMDTMFWGGVTFLLASLIGQTNLMNFWGVWATTWIICAGTSFYLSCLTLPVEKKAVLITGCDTGIGHSLATHFHDMGFRVFAGCLLADTGGEGADILRKKDAGRMHVIQLDVTQKEQVINAVMQVRTLLPEDETLWGLINNAGVSAFGEVEWVSLDTYRRISEINLFGMIRVTKGFLPLIRRARGRVVNMASVCGHISRAGMSPYVLSKFAVEGFSDCLRLEMCSWGVNVCIIEPCNYSAGTRITTEKMVEEQGINMWKEMDQQIREDYSSQYFNQLINVAKALSNSGRHDISPVVNSVSEAVIQKYPRARYRPVTNYYLMKVFIATHLPEWIFSFMYVKKRKYSDEIEQPF